MTSGLTLGNMIRKRMGLPPLFLSPFYFILFYRFPNSHIYLGGRHFFAKGIAKQSKER